MLAFLLLFLCHILLLEGARIVVNDPADIEGTSFIDLFLPSWPVVVAGSVPAYSLFGEYSDMLKSISMPGPGYMGGETRGIPPSNWVKFRKADGTMGALFSYKSVHKCKDKEMVGSTVVDSINILQLRMKFNDRPEFYMSRTGIADRLSLHSVTTPATEMYNVNKLIGNWTLLEGAHSDVRIIPFARECKYLTSSSIFHNAYYVITGAVHDRHWTERQFLAILDDNFDIIKSWVLLDPDTADALTRPQKNWLPFWDKCKLILSKRFGPDHVVGEFKSWRSAETMVDVHTLISSPSPSQVPSNYMIRGSAPPIHHPLLEAGFVVGCIHLRGKTKIYRHALYILETKYPYNIVSFSPLFSFKPYRDIEFVMSMNVLPDLSIELTHGSMDCESRLAVYNQTFFRKHFEEFLKIDLD